jgi:hypothetical protein
MGHFHAPPALLPGTKIPYMKKLADLQSRYGRFGEANNVLQLPGIEFLGHPAHSLAVKPIQLLL